MIILGKSDFPIQIKFTFIQRFIIVKSRKIALK